MNCYIHFQSLVLGLFMIAKKKRLDRFFTHTHLHICCWGRVLLIATSKNNGSCLLSSKWSLSKMRRHPSPLTCGLTNPWTFSELSNSWKDKKGKNQFEWGSQKDHLQTWFNSPDGLYLYFVQAHKAFPLVLMERFACWAKRRIKWPFIFRGWRIPQKTHLIFFSFPAFSRQPLFKDQACAYSILIIL